MTDREMVVTCEPCQDSMHLALAEPGFTRLLALFAGKHDHGSADGQRVELGALQLIPPPTS